MAKSRATARAIHAVHAALDAQLARDRRRLVGRWRLPSGQVLRVVRLDDAGLALCGDGRQRFFVVVGVLHALADGGQITYVGR